MTDSIEDLITTRKSTHGDFRVNAALHKAFMDVVHASPNYKALTPVQYIGIFHKFGKLSRALAGDPNFLDHWRDDQGYTELIAAEISNNSDQS